MKSLVSDAKASGVDVHTGVKYLARISRHIATNKGDIVPQYTINAAGLYADKIAHDFGFGLNYQILPFKGLYLYSRDPTNAFQTNIYPVPNLNQPFLGTHFTLTVDGRAKIGPTAIPALWREHYQRLQHFDMRQIWQNLCLGTKLFVDNHDGFRQLARSELQKYNKSSLIKAASQLVNNRCAENFQQWGAPGIRAQLINRLTGQLEMDFILEGDQTSLHVLNAVSPAYTCALPFAAYCVDRIESMGRQVNYRALDAKAVH